MSESIDDLDLVKVIRRIQINTTHLAESILAGSYHSAFKGKGIEFEEVRDYQPGDDVRSIDWNVTARFGRPFIKNYREERELTVMLAVDLSASCRCGSVHSKRYLIAEVAALLAFSANRNNDRVGLTTFSNKVQTYLAPKKGSKHILRIIRDLLSPVPNQYETDLAAAIAFLASVERRKAICFIISDFIADDFSQPLKLLANKHDVIAIAITDPYEKHFPSIGLATVTDAESGSQIIIDSDVVKLKEKQLQQTSERLKAVETLMHQVGGGYVEISTDKSYVNTLKHFFERRRAR